MLASSLAFVATDCRSAYRSLKDVVRLGALPLALTDGAGTLVFIPWYLLCERVPLDGGDWRFTVSRWMPFGSAGGGFSGDGWFDGRTRDPLRGKAWTRRPWADDFPEGERPELRRGCPPVIAFQHAAIEGDGQGTRPVTN